MHEIPDIPLVIFFMTISTRHRSSHCYQEIKFTTQHISYNLLGFGESDPIKKTDKSKM